MERTEIINIINKLLSEKEIDDRAKPLIKLYFLGKSCLENLSDEQIKSQIDTLCSRIANVEFSSSDKIVTAYEKDANVLTINKKLFIDGKADEAILPLFMKFEEALNVKDRADYNRHIEDFLKAGRIAKEISIPISNRLYKMYEMAEACYGNISHKVPSLSKDGMWRGVCSKYNDALNKIITTGIDDQYELLNGLNLFHNEVFTIESLANPDFEGPYKTEEYQQQAAKIIACINTIKLQEHDKKIGVEQNKISSINNVKLFTGCTDEMINKAFEQRYVGNSRISSILKASLATTRKLTESYIVDRVQAVIDKKPEWDIKIRPLIITFFIRSQKIYNWDIDQFQERLNQLNIKISKISFKDLKDITTVGCTSGNEINLNSRVFLDKNGKFQWPVEKTIFHELGHITDENKREGATTKEPLQMPLVGQYYEWTNTVFERLVIGNNFYKKHNPMQMSTSGYEALGPLGSMFASALGISEVEFAKIKDEGKDYEDKLFAKIFPQDSKESINHGIELIEKIKDIFNFYQLDTYFSLSKKFKNQTLANELYGYCIDLMKLRIEKQLQSGTIEDIEEYNKYQVYHLRKMNSNFKYATNHDGFRFSRAPIVHDIGFCNDKISKNDLLEINRRNIEAADFGFTNDSLWKYSKSIAIATSKNNFYKELQVPENFSIVQDLDTKKSLDSLSSKEDIDKNKE